MKTAYIAVIVVLLTSVVGYLAIDRQEKNEAKEKSAKFSEKYFK